MERFRKQRFRNQIIWSDVFNWTMSFRRNADIQFFYGLIRKRRTPRTRDYLAITKKKTKMAAWMVSVGNAQSKRDDYVQLLEDSGVVVDHIGRGRRFQCPRDNDTRCREMLNQYKFYVSFENSFYDSYITEKFFKNFNLDLILIARGIEQYPIVAPSDIFLNTLSFNSPKDLADKIKYLSSNDDAYAEMLRKKDEYFSIYEDHYLSNNYLETRYEEVSMCQICQRVWNLDKYSKVVPDIDKWFIETKAHLPTDV